MKNCARKRCSPNQSNIKVITRNNKNLCLDCLKVTTFVDQMTPIIVILGKENKNHENWFYENWMFEEERPFEENKTVMKSKLYSNR